MIFVDTSAWLALADRNDRDHRPAREFQRLIMRGDFGKQVTTNHVVTEAVTMIRRRLGVTAAGTFAAGIGRGTEVGIFWVEPVHHREAIVLMTSHRDKSWSLTDCTSFVVMRALEIQNAFTFDRDFGQAGFKILP